MAATCCNCSPQTYYYQVTWIRLLFLPGAQEGTQVSHLLRRASHDRHLTCPGRSKNVKAPSALGQPKLAAVHHLADDDDADDDDDDDDSGTQ